MIKIIIINDSIVKNDQGFPNPLQQMLDRLFLF